MRLYAAVGDRARARAPRRRQLQRLERRAASRATAPADLLAIATAVRLDGNWKDANDVLRDAVRANPRATAANLDWGDVLLEKHNADDAEAAFKDVLKLDPKTPTRTSASPASPSSDCYDGATALERYRARRWR